MDQIHYFLRINTKYGEERGDMPTPGEEEPISQSAQIPTLGSNRW